MNNEIIYFVKFFKCEIFRKILPPRLLKFKKIKKTKQVTFPPNVPILIHQDLCIIKTAIAQYLNFHDLKEDYNFQILRNISWQLNTKHHFSDERYRNLLERGKNDLDKLFRSFSPINFLFIYSKEECNVRGRKSKRKHEMIDN